MHDGGPITDAPDRPVVLDPRPDEVLDREELVRARLEQDEAARRAAGLPGRRRSPRIPGVRADLGRPPAPFTHVPALDGLRGVAVLAVLAYHAHLAAIGGGFLGVSVFFTLSGFLITSLLLRERAREGDISLRAFWGRRFRRLLPAGLACQALVLAMAAAGVWDADQLRSLRTDVPAALAQVVNLSFILRGTSYVGNTAAPSPLNHYWSLSLEEQFYLVFPLVVAGALLLGRGRRRLLVGILVVGTALSAIACWRLGAGDVDRAYFGLDTRLAELLVGALLACALLYRVQLTSLLQRQLLQLLGLAGIGGLAWLAHTARVSSSWLYPGGLLLTAVCTAAVVAAAVQGGLFGRVLAVEPLAWIGRISYGLYLYHWPVFQWLTPRRTGLGTWPLIGLQLAVTFALAVASYHLLEQPIRTRRVLRGRSGLVALPVAMATVVGLLLATTWTLPPRDVSLDGATLAGASPDGGGGARAAAPPPPPQRWLIVGDEVAASLAPDAGTLEALDAEVRVEAAPGCGVSVGGTRIVPGAAKEAVNPPDCAAATSRWTQAVDEFLPDVVVVAAGFWDLTDRQFWSEDPVRRPGEQTFDDFLATEITSRIDEWTARGATVVWTTAPPSRRAMPDGATDAAPANDPARAARFNELVGEIAAGDDRVRVVDLAGWAAGRPGGALAPDLRPDGLTYAPAAAGDVLRWLDDRIGDVRRSADPAPAAAAMADEAQDAALPPAPQLPPRSPATPGRPARVMVVGDSVAFGLAFGLDSWAADTRSTGEATFENKGQFNCPVARGGSYRFQQEVAEFPDRCDWAQMWGQWLNDSRPNLVVLGTGVWDVVDRILPGERRWRHLGDPVADTYFLRELLAAVDLLSSQGARVALVTHHHIEVGANKGFTGLPESEPARIDRLNELMRRAHELRPDATVVVDLASWVASQPGGELDPAKLKDGLHYTDAYLKEIAGWLGPELIAAARS